MGEYMMEASPQSSTLPAQKPASWTDRARSMALTQTFEPTSLADAVQLASLMAKSGLVPKHFAGKPEDIVVAMMMTRQLGLPIILGIQQGHVIGGRFGLPAVMIRGLCEQHPDCEYFLISEISETSATATVKRKSWPEPVKVTYTLEDARRAGLLSRNEQYGKMPKEMLAARVSVTAARRCFPTIVSGLYSVEELRDLPAEEKPETKTVSDPGAGRLDALVAALPATPVGVEAPAEPQEAISGPISPEPAPEVVPQEIEAQAPASPQPALLPADIRDGLLARAVRECGKGADEALQRAATLEWGVAWEALPASSLDWLEDFCDKMLAARHSRQARGGRPQTR